MVTSVLICWKPSGLRELKESRQRCGVGIRMPRLSGMALHDAVSHVNAALGRRFIFSSGDTGDEEAVEFLARTGCPVVPKPFELAMLLSLVERVAATQESPAN